MSERIEVLNPDAERFLRTETWNHEGYHGTCHDYERKITTVEPVRYITSGSTLRTLRLAGSLSGISCNHKIINSHPCINMVDELFFKLAFHTSKTLSLSSIITSKRCGQAVACSIGVGSTMVDQVEISLVDNVNATV
jgi:hypothetical protein